MLRWPIWVVQGICGAFAGGMAVWIFGGMGLSFLEVDLYLASTMGLFVACFASGFVGMFLGETPRRASITRMLPRLGGIAAGLVALAFAGCWLILAVDKAFEDAGFKVDPDARAGSSMDGLIAFLECVTFAVFCVGLASPLSAWLATRGEVKKIECEV